MCFLTLVYVLSILVYVVLALVMSKFAPVSSYGADLMMRYSCFYKALMSILVRLFSGGSAGANSARTHFLNIGILT